MLPPVVPGPPPGAVPPPAPVQAPITPPPPGNSLNGTPIPPVPPAAPASGAVPAAPSAFGGNGSDGPSVAVTTYDPQTGEYLTPEGMLQKIDAGEAPKSWKDLMPT
jgi:phospholipid/cholesterol/gamma-HCH transport system substrate-binding protein